MQVGAIGYQPYIFNTNTIDRASMSRVQAVPDDLTSKKTDYSGLVDREQENTNPLKRGESANFADIIQSQMLMSQHNASRIMKPAEAEATTLDISGLTADGSVGMEEAVMADATDQGGVDLLVDDLDGLVSETIDNTIDNDEVVAGTAADTNIDEMATGEEAVTNMEEAAVGTGAAPRTYDTDEGRAMDSFATQSVIDEPVKVATNVNSGSLFSDMISRFQMRRASEAYAFSMGL
jgi:hypothetical protein